MAYTNHILLWGLYRMIRFAILTISDKAAAGLREDASGPALASFIQAYGMVCHMAVLPDEQAMIEQALRALCDQDQADVILTTGGTGFAPRDVTPEATAAVCTRMAPGLGEAMRTASLAITPHAVLSRAIAGIRQRSVIINLPGSPKAAVECVSVIAEVFTHMVETLRGQAYECGR